VKDHRALEQFISAVRAAELGTRDIASNHPHNVILSEAKDLGSFSK